MISGCYSYSGNVSRSFCLIHEAAFSQGLRYYPAEADGFRGGYYLHERLPSGSEDIYFHDPENDILVLFSGYIYNRGEIAGSSGFRTDDPEPVLAARMFLKEGPDFVRRLNGDFAIFICRPAGKQAYLFRDHAGIRPLSYSFRDGSLFFSSDNVELCRFLNADKGPDQFWLTGLFRYIDFFRTPSPEVERLPPGHYLKFSPGGTLLTKYWDPENIRTDRKMKYDTMLSDLTRLLEDSVAIRCDKRFSAGAHVSSGLDSAVVAALARKEYKSQSEFYGFSWSPSDFTTQDIPYDERDLVRSLCTSTGITPVFSDITPDRFISNLRRFFYNGGFYIEESVAEHASARGINLIFSGWGGDEFISTGDRGIETDLLWHLSFRTYFRRNPVRPVKKFVRYFLEYTLFPALGIMHPSITRAFARETRYLKRGYRRSERKALRNFYFHTSRRQMHLRYLKFYHLQARCETWTTMGYRSGIEYRYPLLDRRIIEYIIKVPSELLCHTDFFRPLLRILGEGIIPDDVRLNRSKKDHVFTAWWDKMITSSGLGLIDETGLWRQNPGLSFIDFNLLEGDITLYKSNHGNVDGLSLFRALVNIKVLHEFTVEFRRKQESAGE